MMENRSEPNVESIAVEQGNYRTGLFCHYLFSDGSAQYVFLDVDDQGCAAVVNPSLSFFSRVSGHVCASCNGLVLFSCFNQTDQSQLVSYNVFNLVTKQLERLPQAQIHRRSIRTGRAFDSQHYQVVRIFSVSEVEAANAVVSNSTNSSTSGGFLEMEIFSSESSVRRRERPLIRLPPELPNPSMVPLYSNGAIHRELGGHLLVYGIGHGHRPFKLIQLPNYVSIHEWSWRSVTFGQCLWESEGRLHFCHNDFEGIHTWVLLQEQSESLFL